MKNVWKQWDEQTNERWLAYVDLNNLYLSVERGTVALNVHVANILWNLSRTVAGKDLFQLNYWEAVLAKLPNWKLVA